MCSFRMLKPNKLSRRAFGKWVLRGGILVPFAGPVVRAQIRRYSNLLIPGAAGGSATCPADGSPSVQEATLTDDDELPIGKDATNFSVGQSHYNDATTRTICKVGFYMATGGGTISGKHYAVKIYTLTGNDLNAVITNGTSDTVTGISASNQWVYFSWSGSKPVMTGGTNYAFVLVSTDATDAVNYAIMWARLAATISGNKAAWNSTGVAQVDSATYEANIKIYWFA